MVSLGTDEPVSGAEIMVDEASTFADASGSAIVNAMRGSTIFVAAEGHDPADATVPDEGQVRIELRPNVVSGTVTGSDGEPIAAVRVFMDGSELMTETGDDGAYELAGLPADGTLIYKMPGYRLTELMVGDEMTKDVTMEPFVARALYAPSAIFEAPGRLEKMLDLIERTEANAMVIDVKETDGRLY